MVRYAFGSNHAPVVPEVVEEGAVVVVGLENLVVLILALCSWGLEYSKRFRCEHMRWSPRWVGMLVFINPS